MRLIVACLSILVVLVFTATGLVRQPLGDEQTSTAIKQLSSADEKERQNGKDKLIQIGQKAVPELIALMNELLMHPVAHYVTGKEREGAAAWENFRKAGESRDMEKLRKASALIHETDITQRLTEDTAELLGRLQAEEAIPLFIDRLLDDENGSAAKIYWTPSMKGLVTMGSLVVPKLIEAIETAKEKAASVKYESGSPSEQRIKWDTELIQTRAAMVLGKIGDIRALPILTNLKCGDRSPMRYYIDEAVKSIFERAK